MKKYLSILLTMLKIGLFTFGGGYAMIAILKDELVEKKGWIQSDEFLSMAAIAESTPGPIAINCATYVGYKRAGVMGAVLATLGICIPSFVIIYLISLFFDAFLSLTLVASAFKGISVCVIYLILTAGLKLFRSLEKSAFDITLFAVTVLCMLACYFLSFSFSSVLIIAAGGAAGVLLQTLGKIKKGGDK